MKATRFDSLARALDAGRSRRGLLAAFAGSRVIRLGLENAAAKKKRKHKKKKKCGKNGRKPIKGKCCTKTVLVNSTCRTCDVCASGCAFTSVQEAIDTATARATVVVCPGTYPGSLTIEKDLQLIGAGDGTSANDTILQGTGNESVVTTANSDIVLQNLRITGGGAAGDGGGISISGGETNLLNCTVRGNTAANFGAGIYSNGGELFLTDCTVSGNTCNGSGGGVFATLGNLELTRCTISDNKADLGGGISNVGGSLYLTTSEISGNTADTRGGGIYNNQTGAVIFDTASRVTGNTAGDTGGGIYNGGIVDLASSANVNGNSPNNCAGTVAVPMCNG